MIFPIISMIFIAVLFTPCKGMNDTIFISNINKSIRFDACFSNVFAANAMNHIREIKSKDKNNFTLICGSIRHLIQTERTCDYNDIIPILKEYGSLGHFLNYKKMFHIYFKQIKGLMTWAQQVYYITDEHGYFIYVEFKNIYPNKHLVFDQSLLNSVRIHKHKLQELGFIF